MIVRLKDQRYNEIMNYQRPLQASLLDRLSRPVTVIHVMIGPRQVGKTTIARQIQDTIGIPAPDSWFIGPLDAGSSAARCQVFRFL
jgi:predicted AAA+ superfamily ATPase